MACSSVLLCLCKCHLLKPLLPQCLQSEEGEAYSFLSSSYKCVYAFFSDWMFNPLGYPLAIFLSSGLFSSSEMCILWLHLESNWRYWKDTKVYFSQTVEMPEEHFFLACWLCVMSRVGLWSYDLACWLRQMLATQSSLMRSFRSRHAFLGGSGNLLLSLSLMLWGRYLLFIPLEKHTMTLKLKIIFTMSQWNIWQVGKFWMIHTLSWWDACIEHLIFLFLMQTDLKCIFITGYHMQ